MLFPTKKFDDVIKEMKSFGELLIPYNTPRVSQVDEDEICIIKTREVAVDGYNTVIYYSKSDWADYYIEILQVTGRYTPFLPFSLVCKIGKKFLGERYLSYVDFLRDNRKTYCWTVASDKSSTPISAPYKKEIVSDDCVYEGFCYKCLNPLQSISKKF